MSAARLKLVRLSSSGWRLWLGLGLVLMTASGCQFAPTKPTSLWPWKKSSPPALPDRLLAVWSDSVLHQPGLPGVRGFGGRVYFYQTEGSDPIEVDGALAVYVFDADELELLDQKPIKKFVFTADQFTEHMSKTSLGPSDSVWLPWDEVGGEARRLSLITRFEGREGGTVISDPTIKLLPGTSRLAKKGEPNSDSSSSPVRVVGHQRSSSEPVVGEGVLRSRAIQTIDLPPAFRQRLKSDGGDKIPGPGVSPLDQPTLPRSVPPGSQTAPSPSAAAGEASMATPHSGVSEGPVAHLTARFPAERSDRAAINGDSVQYSTGSLDQPAALTACRFSRALSLCDSSPSAAAAILANARWLILATLLEPPTVRLATPMIIGV